MKKKVQFIGLDVHKKSITVAIADEERDGEVRLYGTISNSKLALGKLVRKLQSSGCHLEFVYEAGPCGYEIYRYFKQHNLSCTVIAPSMTPKKSGDKVKTDKRDAITLARLHRAGELTAVYVPEAEDEAMRDLTRTREDMMKTRKKIKAQLGAFLLRQGHHYTGGQNWTKAHLRWLAEQRMEHPAQQIAFQEYVDTISELTRRIERIDEQTRLLLKDWKLKPVVEALQSLKGVSMVAAVSIVAELGDICRFDNPKQLMAFLGLTPSEYSSGETVKRGRITKSGNTHVRRMLVECSWAYRFQARVSKDLRKRQQDLDPSINDISWKAQIRLSQRYKKLIAKGKPVNKTLIAVARELVGFIWAITQQVAVLQTA